MPRRTLSLLALAALLGCTKSGSSSSPSTDGLTCAERATIANRCVPNGRSVKQLTAECEEAQKDPQKRALNKVTGACFTQHKENCQELQSCILKGLSQSHPEAD